MTEPTPLSKETAGELVEKLSRGWSKGRVDLMIELFTPEAVFRETPFSESIQGHDSIRKWASDIPYHQSEAKFTTGEVFLVAAGPHRVSIDR